MRSYPWFLSIVLLVTHSSAAQCPWHWDIKELQSSCICAFNMGQELSVQCDMVDFPRLLSALDRYARTTPLDLLYVNNSTVIKIDDGAFKNLRIHNVQLSGCKIRNIAPGAFRNQERTLKNLNLQDNELEEVPVESLRSLSNLSLLDLSRNLIGRVPDKAFATLQSLSTLKLSDNNLTLSSGAFKGLEGILKNLNLKGTRQKNIPEAVRGLRTLAFLDLAQNGLRELPGPAGHVLEGLHSLTALNLERNLIQSVGSDAFSGVNDTLSSLSLLNNLMTDFPTAAINSITELRVKYHHISGLCIKL
jgi:Leucine-rich repeat (LRR) protein